MTKKKSKTVLNKLPALLPVDANGNLHTQETLRQVRFNSSLNSS